MDRLASTSNTTNRTMRHFGAGREFYFTQRAAKILQDHPQIALAYHLKEEAFDGRRLIVQVNGIEALRFIVYMNGRRIFYTADEESTFPLARFYPKTTVEVEDYPNAQKVFEIVGHQYDIEEQLTTEGSNLRAKLAAEGCKNVRVEIPIDESGQRTTLLMEWNKDGFHTVYRGANLFHLYSAYYEYSKQDPDIKHDAFVDLGSGLGYNCHIASLFFRKVLGIEISRTLFEISLQVQKELGHAVVGEVNLEHGNYYQRDISDYGFAYIWSHNRGVMREELEQLKGTNDGTKIMAWHHICRIMHTFYAWRDLKDSLNLLLRPSPKYFTLY